MSLFWHWPVELMSRTVGEREDVAADRHAFFSTSLPLLSFISISNSFKGKKSVSENFTLISVLLALYLSSHHVGHKSTKTPPTTASHSKKQRMTARQDLK